MQLLTAGLSWKARPTIGCMNLMGTKDPTQVQCMIVCRCWGVGTIWPSEGGELFMGYADMDGKANSQVRRPWGGCPYPAQFL